MKKNLLKSVLLALMVLVGGTAWAQTTTLLEYGTDNVAWTADNLAEWTAGGTPTITDGYVGITGGNGSYSTSKTIEPTANAIINVQAVWRGRSNTGRDFSKGNGSYFRFGNIVVAQNDQSKKHGYTFKGLDDLANVTTFSAGNYRVDIANCTWLLIEMEINTASNTVTSFSIKSEDGATVYATASDVVLSDADYTTVAFGYRKSGSVSTSNAEQLKSIKITQTLQVVETADYTVKYVCNGTEIKDAETRTGVVGQDIALTDNDIQDFYAADGSMKYIYVSSDVEGKTVGEGVVVTVTFREAEKFAWTAKSSVGTYAISGETWEGDKASAKYPLYVLVDGKLWKKDAIDKTFAQSFDVTENNQEFALEYAETDIDNVVFLAEVEDIEGMGIVASGNAEARSSKRAAGYSASGNTAITSLPLGKYKMTASFYSPTSAGGKYNFYTGNRNIWEVTTGNSNATNADAEAVLAKENNEISLGQTGYTAAVDYIFIQTLGEPTAEELEAAAAADEAADKAAAAAAALKAAKDALQTVIDEAKAIETEGKQGVDEFTAAIATAEAALAAEDATVESLTAAKAALAEAVKAFEDANKPGMPEIANADFSESTPIDNHLCGYGKDMAGKNTTYYGLQDITGWNKVIISGDNATADYPNSGLGGAVFAYGSAWEMKGNNKSAPAVGPNGEAGNALGFFGVWGCGGYYYQEVTLPAGKYTMFIPIYNQSGTQANESYTGFFVSDEVKYTVAINTTVGAWVTQSLEFELAEETTGQIRLGYKSTGGGSGANPMIFIDGVTIKSELDGAITAYEIALAAANTAAANEVVTGEEKTALNEAIAANSNIDMTSVEAIKAATAALNAAVEAFNAAIPSYEALVAANAMVAELVDLPYANAEKKPEAKTANTAEAAATAAEEVKAGLRAYYESNALAEAVEGATVLAETIVNPAAMDGTNGWTTTLGEGSGGSIGVKDGTAGKEEPWTDAAGSTAHKYFDGGNWGANAWDVTFSQNITLEAGKYLLSAISRASGDVAQYLFAGTDSVKTAVIGAAGGIFNRGWNIHNVEFEVKEAGTVEIGVRGITNVVHNWMSFSDFRLVQLEKYVAPEPKTDYTDYIVNADLNNKENKGWDDAGTKGIDGSGVVKVGNAAAFDFNQTIANLPAGKYKVTAQAAYRYGADETAEYEAITNSDAITKLVQLYATVGTKTVAQPVQNRWDGASETDLAGGGAVVVNEKYVPNSTNAVKAWFAAGKYVNELEFNLPADGAVTIGINRISTPASDYTVIGPWTLTRLGDAEEENPTYTITIAETQNGTVEADKAEAAEGETVKVTVTPNEGFMVDEAYWTYGETKTEIEKPEEGNTAEFVMPAANVTITVTFKKTEWKPGDDATFLIVNNSFETGDLTGWTVGSSSDTGVKPNSDGTYTTEGCDGNYLFNTWWQGIPITQTVTGLPNGLFELKALMANDAITAGNQPGLYLLTNGEHSEAFSSPNAGTFAEGTMQFYVTDGTATIGAIGGNADGSFNEAGYYWYKVDNFRLTFVEALPNIEDIEIPEGKMSNAAAQAIADAKTAGDVVALLNAVKAAKESIAAYASAKSLLDDVKEVIDGTNVYTQEAYDTYNGAYEGWLSQYNEGTLSDTDAKNLRKDILPSRFILGTDTWHWQNTTDNFLLSAWDTNPDFVDAPYYINMWSMEGETDGSDFKVPFFEYWTSDGNSLGEKTLTATMTDLEAGNYEVKAWVRVRIKNGAEAPAAGITFQANDGEAVNAADGEQINNSQFYLKEVVATGTVAEDGVLNIKFNVAAENNISWLSFKNVWFEKVEAPEPPVEVRDWIVFAEPATAGSLAEQYTSTDEDLVLTYVDTDNKISIDANNAFFGTADSFDKFTHRMKTGGKSSSKNNITLTIPAEKLLKVYVRSASGSATDRNLVLTQNGKEIYNKVVKDEDAVAVDMGGENPTKVFPVVSVYVKEGTVEVTYPTGALNFYGFELTAVPTGINNLKQTNVLEGTIYNLNGQKVEKTKKGLYIINGKKVVIK